MEHPEGNLSNPNDDLAKHRFGVRESFGGSESDVEKKKREEEEKLRKQAEKRRREEQERHKRVDEGAQEQGWLGGDKPAADKRPEGFLGALFGEGSGEKDQKSDTSSEDAPASSTEQSPEGASAKAKWQAPSNQAEADPIHPEAETTESIKLDPSEKAEAAKIYVAERLKRIDEDADVAPSNTPEANDDIDTSSDSFAKQFLQRLQQRLDEGDPTVLEDDQLDQLANEVATIESEGVEPVETATEVANIDASTDIDSDSGPETDSLSYDDIDVVSAEDGANPEWPDNDATAPSVSLQPTAGGSSGGSGGGSAPGSLPLEASSAGWPGSEPRSAPLGSMAGEASPTTVAREVARGVRSGGEFFLGAFVGYFIGRRRGRNKAEAELAPQQKKIEKELRDVQSSIEEREQALTAALSAKATETKTVSNEAQPLRSHSEAVQYTQLTEAAVAKSVQRKAAKEMSASASPAEQASVEPTVEQRAMPESKQAPRAPAPEIVAAKTVRSVVESEPKMTASERMRGPHPTSIDSLPRAELLNKAQVIEFRGESLRHMYETAKVNEAIVREVMRLEAHGQSYDRLLMRRMAEREAAQIGQSGEQMLDPHPERYVADSRGAERKLESAGSAVDPDSSQSGAAGEDSALYPQPGDSGRIRGGADNVDNQTSVAPQVAVGVALGIVFFIMLFWLFG